MFAQAMDLLGTHNTGSHSRTALKRLSLNVCPKDILKQLA